LRASASGINLIQGRPRRTVMLNGSSYADELGYREILEAWERDGTYPVTYAPTISRPRDARNAGWTGLTGRAEGVILDVCRDLDLRPQETVRVHLRQPGHDHQR